MDEADEISMGFYMLLWGVFTIFMFIATLKQNRAIQVVFLTLAILFFGLAVTNFTGIEFLGMISGFVGIICGASAIYASLGLVLREAYGREILLLCEPKTPEPEPELTEEA